MSNQQHTPEPWKYTFNGTHPQDGDLENVEVTPVGDDDLGILLACGCCQGLSCSKANIERIIACVNACKGINPEAIRELLAACEAVINFERRGIELCHAAIAKANVR